MHQFYFKTLLRSLVLLCASLLLAYLCIQASYHKEELSGTDVDRFRWFLYGRDASAIEGTSTILARIERSTMSMDFRLGQGRGAAAVGAVMMFVDRQGQRTMVDLSGYHRFSFETSCTPRNSFILYMSAFDDQVSREGDLLTYRPPYFHFDCSERPTRIEVDLTRMTMPGWWFDVNQVNPSYQGYSLRKVTQFEFHTGPLSPVDVASHVEMRKLTLHGRRYDVLYLLAGLLALAWGGFAYWVLRAYTRAVTAEVQNRLQKNLPFVAYQKLSLEPQQDKDNSALLTYLGSHYSNPDLDLETVVSATGLSRNKINDILKAELGYTFIAYLNKLRMTEAARLLRENTSTGVAEIAYSVGYNNVSYFNKLFKAEYHSTPKVFREACAAQSKTAG